MNVNELYIQHLNPREAGSHFLCCRGLACSLGNGGADCVRGSPNALSAWSLCSSVPGRSWCVASVHLSKSQRTSSRRGQVRLQRNSSEGAGRGGKERSMRGPSPRATLWTFSCNDAWWQASSTLAVFFRVLWDYEFCVTGSLKSRTWRLSGPASLCH